ncbi:hypothetical protein LZ554_008290 [Drepanopeziza brunnea f. sp. 'monogermtubi']|nr:hypothetical protein LZ554_008290 [Drepanopeziza brunnea f. sp. 'monogermtubi']
MALKCPNKTIPNLTRLSTYQAVIQRQRGHTVFVFKEISSNIHHPPLKGDIVAPVQRLDNKRQRVCKILKF